MKIAIIGGGSTYTPEVVDGLLAKADDLKIDEVVLMDIDTARLGVLGEFCRRMASHAGARFKVVSTTDRKAAIEGADFILTQFRVGGQAARYEDEKLGLRHNLIGQETTGIGGMAKALRTIPAIMDICADVEKTAPDAWIINFTNPSGIITQAILGHTGCRCVGLCNVPLEMKMTIAAFLGADEGDVRMESVGLNHLGWVRRVTVKGEDVMPRLLEFLTSADGPANIPDVAFPPEVITSLGAVPLYYDRYYYNTQSVLSELLAKPKTRAQEVMEIEEKLLAIYRDPNIHEKPAELTLRGGAFYSKIAVEIIDAVAHDTGAEHVVNTTNRGAMPDLPDDAVVEVNCRIGKTGASPLPTGRLEPSMRALVQRAKAYEDLTIEAALTQSRSAAFRAIVTNPLGPVAERASEVLDDLLRTNRLEYR